MNKLELIREVKEDLSEFGEPNQEVLEALRKVDRMDYMNTNKQLAYENEAIPIGYGQTISQPSTVTRMISLLELKKSDKVLEIGTGSLWNAAIIAYLAKEVVTLEIVEQLIDSAQAKIKKHKINNIEVRNQNFLKVKEKFNKIIFTAGILKGDEHIIKEFAKIHLKASGILVCPFRNGPLIIIKKQKNKLIISYTQEEYSFVPLIL